MRGERPEGLVFKSVAVVFGGRAGSNPAFGTTAISVKSAAKQLELLLGTSENLGILIGAP